MESFLGTLVLIVIFAGVLSLIGASEDRSRENQEKENKRQDRDKESQEDKVKRNEKTENVELDKLIYQIKKNGLYVVPMHPLDNGQDYQVKGTNCEYNILWSDEGIDDEDCEFPFEIHVHLNRDISRGYTIPVTREQCAYLEKLQDLLETDAYNKANQEAKEIMFKKVKV